MSDCLFAFAFLSHFVKLFSKWREENDLRRGNKGEEAREGKKERRTCNFWFYCEMGRQMEGVKQRVKILKFEKIICIRKREKRERHTHRERDDAQHGIHKRHTRTHGAYNVGMYMRVYKVETQARF